MVAIETDILIIGSGIAGLAFALDAAQFGSVAVVTKRADASSASVAAQGGLAAVFADDDSVDLHIADTLTAGDGLCDTDVVADLLSEAPDAVRRLLALGARFDRTATGAPDLHREGGHTRNRIVHAGDATGREVVRVLLDAVRRLPSVRLYRDHTAVDLTLEHSGDTARCTGAYVLDTDGNRLVRFSAKATVLCTGGAGHVYARTTNPSVATGDGVALAYRAGARLRHLEFVQFHPTALHAETPVLITEALRGAGAELRTADGTAFMERYHPMGSLAPRDVVARAVYRESRGDNGVYLDATRLGGELHSRFPGVVAHCREHGIDPGREMIPVVPAAHYLCGGVATDTRGRTSIPGLYACGETACTGLHGANRLASNSLTEALITARRAAADVVRRLPDRPGVSVQQPPYTQPCTASHGSPAHDDLRRRIRTLMWNTVGIVRTPDGLHRAVGESMELLREADHRFFSQPLTDSAAELRNMALTAHLIALAAFNRRDSRGAHYVAQYVRTRAEADCATGDSDGTDAVCSPCTDNTAYEKAATSGFSIV